MTTAEAQALLKELHSLANPRNVEGMARFGISSANTLGISIPVLRKIARRHHGDHRLSLQLWASGLHEARLLAAFIDDPSQVTETQMEAWARDFDSWDVCDQVCANLFDKTPFAYEKVDHWSRRSEEFVKRAAFALMASLAVHDKKAGDEVFEGWLRLIVREAGDERNFVRKAVNWALRQIGKRNRRLGGQALRVARELSESSSKSARWIGTDALRELQDKMAPVRNRK